MQLIQKIILTLAVLTLNPSSLLAYPVIVTVYQKSSEVIQFNAANRKSHITRDLEPGIMKRYIIEGDSDDLDELTFNIKDQNTIETINLDTLLEFGNIPYLKINPAPFNFLGQNVVYRLLQDYTWGNTLHWDDTLYFTIEFLNFEAYTKLLFDEYLSKNGIKKETK